MTYTKKDLEEAVNNSTSYAGVLRYLGKSVSGAAYKYIKKNIQKYKLNISHFKNGNTFSNTKSRPTKHTWEEILTYSDKPYRIGIKKLRRALLESGREYKCEWCNISDWRNKDLTLEIDHIDGDWHDNTTNNLRFLCPNCHSQTDKYRKCRQKTHYCDCGKPKYKHSLRCIECARKNQKPRNKLSNKKQHSCKCGNPKHEKSKLCFSCSHIQQRKVDRPTKEELEKLVWEKPTSDIAKDYGISDNAVGKWCKSYDIDKPPRGYWTKRKRRNQ